MKWNIFGGVLVFFLLVPAKLKEIELQLHKIYLAEMKIQN